MADKPADPEVKVPDGWAVTHQADPQVLKADGPGASVITVKDGNYVASKRVDGMLVEQQGSSPEQLNARIEAWEAGRSVPNPMSEDGNRELSADEKLESGKATLSMQITQGARTSALIDQTPEQKPEELKGELVSVGPVVESESVKGEDVQATTLISGPQSTESKPANK